MEQLIAVGHQSRIKANRVQTSTRGKKLIMLRTLKILCVLLKVLMLMRAALTFSSKDQENHIAQNTVSTEYFFKIIDIRDYIMMTYISSNIESVQNHFNERNEVVLQEGSTSSSESIPSEPIFPRAFVDFGNKDQKDIFVTFRWNKPKFTNGVIQKYRIHYWFENWNRTIQINVDVHSTTVLQYKMYDLKPDTMYYFKVQAHNEVGAGFFTEFINVSTTHENPIPLLYVNSRENMLVLDADLQIGLPLSKHNIYEPYKEMVYSALEHQIYGITVDMEIITWNLNPTAIETKSNYTKIATLDYNPAHNLCIDWVARNLYWIQYSNDTHYIMKLDLTLWQMGIVKYDIINTIKINWFSTFLNVLPSVGYIYWKELIWDEQYIIMQSDLDGKNVKPFMKNEYNKCFCSYKLLEPSSRLQIDNTNINKPLIYWTLNDRLIAADIYGCRCKMIFSTGNNRIYLDYLTIDKTNIYLYSSSVSLFYILNKKDALESKENAFKHVQKIHTYFNIYEVISLDKSLQPYPPMICLIPNMKDYHVEEKTITEDSIDVSLPEPILNNGCKKYNLATIIYTISVSYWTCLNNELNKFEEFNVQTYKRYYKIRNLTPLTEYTLKLALSNFYVDKLSMGLQFGSDVKLTTAPGKFNAPENVTIQVLTPTMAAVYWMPPKKLNCVPVIYEVHWMLVLDVQFADSTQNVTLQHRIKSINQYRRTIDGKFFTTIQSLLPKQTYMIYVRVYIINFSYLFADSLRKYIHMYLEFNNLNLIGVSTKGMNISWIPSTNLTIHPEFRSILEYKNDTMQKWQIASNAEVNNDKITYYIKNLMPRTLYKFRLILKYPEHEENVIWPSDGKEFTFETLGDIKKIPSAPGIPTITRLPNFKYQLNWKPAQAYDAPLYRLEGLIVENNYEKGNQTDKNRHWNLYYNGTDNYWLIKKDMNQKYRFRVQAENAYGFGEWSELSVVIDLTESVQKSVMQYYVPLILSLIVILVMCNVYYFYCSHRHRKESNEIVPFPIMTDMELTTLNEIPFEYIQLNLLYTPRLQRNQDEFALTIIEKNQIIFKKLLGSGAFGKVFEGIVKDFEGSDTTPVAIKMLRKNAFSRMNKEFLQEAKLMSHFRHKNVLRLLGICLDADSPLLILELIEPGDLLKYLRENRTLPPSDSHALRLQDLLAMCEDVARGCCYLEKQHFVHRDLACRNCLISVRNHENHIVKIGDFGLARDIYKDDYYRMKGEGLLPVRWMAPESLMFGIFTSQSDVWAFGVLMWEIMSLGEHPYPAISNSEVLQYVRDGGKLPKPLNCPSILYHLMLRCWNTANERPNFMLCLENIITLRYNTEDAMLSSVDIIKRVELLPSRQIEDVVRSHSLTSIRLTANDAANDVIEPPQSFLD